ncbi:hypothetical protein VNI00_006160 [Paramarasmius palmivorus]|uniref:DUF6534 domain-containing protein n=1 Tax=Paramarasmius palmivorus TaxID=297713 RepID=A0AAW0DBE4_9AGAR
MVCALLKLTDRGPRHVATLPSRRSAKTLATIIALPIVGSAFVTALVYFIRSWAMKTYAELKSLQVLFQVVNSLALASNIAITLSIAGYLWVEYSVNWRGSSSRGAFVNRLAIFCISAGIFTSVFAALGLVVLFTVPDTLVHVAFLSVVARLHTSSFFSAILNFGRSPAVTRGSNRPSFVRSATLQFAPTISESESGGQLRSRSLGSVIAADPAIPDIIKRDYVTDPVRTFDSSVKHEVDRTSGEISYVSLD